MRSSGALPPGLRPRNSEFRALQHAPEPEVVAPERWSARVAVPRAKIHESVMVPRPPADDFLAGIVVAACPLPDVARQVVQSPLRISRFVRAHWAGRVARAADALAVDPFTVPATVPARTRAGLLVAPRIC